MSKYEKVESYYKRGIWTKDMVWDAVGRWITEEEYETIVGDKYN